MKATSNTQHTNTKFKFAGNLQSYSIDKLYDDHAPTLYGVILRIVKDELIAEEALSNCFLKIKNAYQQFQGTKEILTGWLIQNARQAAYERIQDKLYRSQLIANELYKCQLYLNDGEPCGLYDKVKNVHVPVSEECRTILDYLFFEGLTIDQIADKLNMTQEKVRQHLTTAVKSLRES